MTDAATPSRPDDLFQGVPYAYAATAAAGSRIVHLAGACPLDAQGRVVAAGDVAGQAAACLRNLALALTGADAGIGDVVHVRALVASADRADLARVWEVVHDFFGGRTPPGTLLGVTVLGWPGQLVEIEAVAAIAPPRAAGAAASPERRRAPTGEEWTPA